MRLSPCLLSVAILSTSVSAFFPYKSKAEAGASNTGVDLGKINGRFFPWVPSSSSAKDALAGNHGKAPTLEIKKLEPGQVRRDNQYSIVEGDTPTKDNSIAVSQDGFDYSYITRVAFGSQSQELWMLIDTGAATTWVMGADCISESCSQHDTFDDEASTTFTASEETWDVTYGSGEVKGHTAQDNVTFGDLEVFMEFGIATDASDDFLSYPMDGILGLGRTGDNEQGTPTMMQALTEAGLIEANILGINLPRNSDGATDGQITFGDVDEEKFSGDISYTDTVPDYDLWLIPLDDAGVDGTAAGFTNKQAIIDTGSSYLLLPVADMEQIHSLIPGAEPVDDEFVVPCSTTALLQFTFSGVTYDVSPKDYVFPSDGSSDMCASNIKTLPDYYGADMWLLGDVFLKNVYSVFDFDAARIGFAFLDGETSASTTDGSFSPSDSAAATTGDATNTASAPDSTGASATISAPPQLVLVMSILTAAFSSLQFMGIY